MEPTLSVYFCRGAIGSLSLEVCKAHMRLGIAAISVDYRVAHLSNGPKLQQYVEKSVVNISGEVGAFATMGHSLRSIESSNTHTNLELSPYLSITESHID